MKESSACREVIQDKLLVFAVQFNGTTLQVYNISLAYNNCDRVVLFKPNCFVLNASSVNIMLSCLFNL